LIVRVVLTRAGRIAEAQLLRGPTDPETEAAIAEALRHWRMRPALVRGQAENVYQNLTLLPREAADQR
jgi:TonB family protein